MNTLEVGSQMAAVDPMYVIAPPFQGVGVLRYPVGSTPVDGDVMNNKDLAQRIAQQLQPGSVLIFPNTRDYEGAYDWDFRIEGGPVDQIRIERSDSGPSLLPDDGPTPEAPQSPSGDPRPSPGQEM